MIWGLQGLIWGLKYLIWGLRCLILDLSVLILSQRPDLVSERANLRLRPSFGRGGGWTETAENRLLSIWAGAEMQKPPVKLCVIDQRTDQQTDRD